MGWKSEKGSLIPHSRAISKAEMEAFGVVHTMAKNLVLLPVIVNGEQRFALALVRGNGVEMHSMIVGYLAMPGDELITVDGGISNPMKADNEKKDIKHLH